MQLSEAIRLGAMIRPQCFGRLFLNGRSCALGAAVEAAGVKLSDPQDYDALRARWPILNVTIDDSTVLDTIVLSNDCSELTREQIADWVETIEAQAADLSLDGAVESEATL